MSKTHIFLSYSSKDVNFALKLAQDLRLKGISIWMDRLDGIRVGDDWIKALEYALNDAIALIAVFSPRYIQSTFCRAELVRASSLGYPIFPILLELVPPTDVPLVIQSTQYADFTAWETATEYDLMLTKLIGVMTDKLGLTPQAPIASYILAPKESVAVLRELESSVNNVKTNIPTTGTPAHMRRMKRLEQQLEILSEQYDAVVADMNVNLNPASRVLLGRQADDMERKMTEIETELAQLKS